MHLSQKRTRSIRLQIVGSSGENIFGSRDLVFLEDQTLQDIKDKGKKMPFYDGSDLSSNSLEPTPVIHGEGEGQMQTDAIGKEAPTKDINHGDAGEKPPPMAPVMTLMLYRSSRETVNL